MTISICISCGATKSHYGEECPACHFKPETKTDLAKSLLLSQEAAVADLDLPKAPEELTAISSSIANGQHFAVDQAQLDELQKRIDEVEAFAKRITWPRLVFLYGLPVVLVWLAIGYFLYQIFR